MSIGPISRAASAYQANAPLETRPTPRSSQAAAPASLDFSSRIGEAVDAVDAQQTSADQLLAELASAERVDLHGTMIAMEKADIALRTMVSVRDKAIAAYEQIMNMAI